MKRRHLLQMAGTGICSTANAGCLGGLSTNSVSGKPMEVGVEQSSSDHDALEYRAEMIEPRITESHTATVRTAAENTGNEEIEIQADPSNPTYIYLEGHSLELILIPVGEFDYQREGDRCWSPENTLGSDLLVKQTVLQPGEQAVIEYELWTPKESQNTCIQRGRYEFVDASRMLILTIT
ncbi:hypothetical protein [Haloarchaeobius baliensis]|uniref:hypothetical protein n=1 Tax=Haloarchaeobius baliensis TaxID=1670458 RepID=UPI003F881027